MPASGVAIEYFLSLLHPDKKKARSKVGINGIIIRRIAKGIM